MAEPVVHPLPKEASSMCAFCHAKATHFIVITYSYGRLTPVCGVHAEQKLY